MAKVTCVSQELNNITKRLHYNKWSRDFMNEQSKTTKMIRKFVENPVKFDFFGNDNRKIAGFLKKFERHFW